MAAPTPRLTPENRVLRQAVRVWRVVRDWCVNSWSAIRPGPEARRGAVWGTLGAAATTVILAGVYLRTGFGYAFDFAFAALFASSHLLGALNTDAPTTFAILLGVVAAAGILEGAIEGSALGRLALRKPAADAAGYAL